VKIDKEMMMRAIKTTQIDFLYCVFAYNKNYQEDVPGESSEK